MKKLLLCGFIVLSITRVHAQLKTQDLRNTLWHSEDDKELFYLYHYKKKYFIFNSFKYPISVSENLYGFYDSDNEDDYMLKHIDSLKETGSTLYELDAEPGTQYDETGEILNPWWVNYTSVSYVSTIIRNDTIFNLHDVSSRQQYYYFYKVERLPKRVEREIKDKYKECYQAYLEATRQLEIKSKEEKAYIYSAPDTITKMYLIKGDIFKVVSEQDDWIEMEYETAKGRIIRGWLRREDVEG